MRTRTNSAQLKKYWAAALLAVCWPGFAGTQPTDATHEAGFAIDSLGMELSEEELSAITRSMTYARQVSTWAEKKNGLPYRRDAHAKATGCVRATFSINGDIPEHFRHSVFATPGREYQAWIRFSNGDMLVQPDAKPDARGMAIKLMNVDGEKIAPELAGAKTQDFIMTNMPVFFNRDIFDYVDNMKYLAEEKRLGWFVSLWPPRLHPRRLSIAVETVSSKIKSPLQPQYYSMLPYQLGNTPVKFSVRHCSGMQFDSDVNTADEDFLTEVMSQQLQNGEACFDFMLQEKIPGRNMPLDDATVVWSEQASPFVPVARVVIPAQTFTSEAQQSFCENLSMNPWHGVGDWLPLGSLSKARRLVYHAVSQFRHQKNGATSFEPNSWCLDAQQQNCDLAGVFHNSVKPVSVTRCFDEMYQPLDGSEPPPLCN